MGRSHFIIGVLSVLLTALVFQALWASSDSTAEVPDGVLGGASDDETAVGSRELRPDPRIDAALDVVLSESSELGRSQPEAVVSTPIAIEPSCREKATVEQLVVNPEVAWADCFWSSRTFNPSKTRVDRQLAEAFLVELRPRLQALQDLQDEAERMAGAQFAHVMTVQAPGPRPLATDDYWARLQASDGSIYRKDLARFRETGRLEIRMSVAYPQGVHYVGRSPSGWTAARRADFAEARPFLDAQAFATQEVVRFCVSYSERLGCLSHTEAEQLLERCQKLVKAELLN